MSLPQRVISDFMVVVSCAGVLAMTGARLASGGGLVTPSNETGKNLEFGVKVSLNDNEDALVDAYCQYTGAQKAAFIRELILSAAQKSLFGDGAPNFAASNTPLQAVNQNR